MNRNYSSYTKEFKLEALLLLRTSSKSAAQCPLRAAVHRLLDLLDRAQIGYPKEYRANRTCLPRPKPSTLLARAGTAQSTNRSSSWSAAYSSSGTPTLNASAA